MTDAVTKILILVVAVVVVFTAGTKIVDYAVNGELSPIVSDIDSNVVELKEQTKRAKDEIQKFSELTGGATTTSDNRLPADTLVLGVVVDGKAKAYHVQAVKREGEITDEFRGKTFVLKHDEKLDEVEVYEKNEGRMERITFSLDPWFSWLFLHPDTELFK